MEPRKPYILDGQAPPSNGPDWIQDQVAFEQQEAARIQRMGMSGPLGQGPYSIDYEISAQSEEAKARSLEQEAKIRAVNGGISDSW